MWLNFFMNLKKYPLRLLLRGIAIALILLGLLSFAQDLYLSYEVAQTQKKLEVIRTETKTAAIESTNLDVNSAFYSINEDYVGWIEIEDSPISYPVVLGQDNAYYLNHNFYKDPHELGAIFMDYRNLSDLSDPHIAIYGHSAHYSAMFGYLNKYLDEDFARAHPTITLETKEKTYRYQVFSVYIVDADVTTLDIPSSPESIQAWLNYFQSQSSINLDVDISKATQVLSLVSCEYSLENGRIIVQAIPLD
jgi:sortase B